MIKHLVLLLLLSILTSCGGSEGSLWPTETEALEAEAGPATSEMYTYAFNDKKCTTDDHSFPTFNEVCSALTDDELNNGCAEAKREDLFFEAECPGSFI